MLDKNNRLTKRKEFGYIYKHGRFSHNSYLTLLFAPTKLTNVRVGFSVSKKVGKAWQRNKIKRQLRDIVRNNFSSLNSKYNYVFVAKPEIVNLSYEQIKYTVLEVITKAKL